LSREICWAPRFIGRPEDERTKADGPAEVGGPCSTARRGNARRARRVEPWRAREGGPGQDNGVAARTADRNSRRLGRVRSRGGLEPIGDRRGGGAGGDRQCRYGHAGDGGGGDRATDCGDEE